MENKSYKGIYRGIVEDINDPLNLGRCRIRIPSIHGTLSESQIGLLPWARYVSPLPTGNNKGMFIIPEVKDVVWVLFEGGNKLYPIYIGSTYGIVNDVNEVPIDSGESIETTEVLYKSKDMGGKRAMIKKTSDNITLSLGNSYVKINTDGSMDIHSEGALNISSDSVINIKGPRVNIN